MAATQRTAVCRWGYCFPIFAKIPLEELAGLIPSLLEAVVAVLVVDGVARGVAIGMMHTGGCC